MRYQPRKVLLKDDNDDEDDDDDDDLEEGLRDHFSSHPLCITAP